MKAKTETDELSDGAGGVRGEPGGRAQRPAGGAPLEIPDAIRDRLSDEVIDELLAGARTEEEIVGPGGVLAQLTKRAMISSTSCQERARIASWPSAVRNGPPGQGTGPPCSRVTIAIASVSQKAYVLPRSVTRRSSKASMSRAAPVMQAASGRNEYAPGSSIAETFSRKGGPRP